MQDSTKTTPETTELAADSVSKKSIGFKLPLAIAGTGDIGSILKQKFQLIRKFNIAQPEKLHSLIKLRTDQNLLSPDDQAYLNDLWTQTELDDLDYTELFICFLPTIIDHQNSKFLMSMDPSPAFSRTKYGDQYDEFIKRAVRKSADSVMRFALPRVRAKLAVKEIICLITSDSAKIAELIRISPRYLACTVTTDLIARSRSGQLSSNANVRNKSTATLERISQSIAGPTKRQPRRYGYWKVDYYYTEILECVKIINTMNEVNQRKEYIRAVDLTWGLPEGYPELLLNKFTSPAELTLGILVAKGMITDASTYRNVIRPHVKKLKEKYPSIRACDYLVEHLLDTPTKEPDQFSKFDLWKQLESFQFDLSDEEIGIGHAISYPTTVIGV